MSYGADLRENYRQGTAIRDGPVGLLREALRPQTRGLCRRSEPERRFLPSVGSYMVARPFGTSAEQSLSLWKHWWVCKDSNLGPAD
jgi:hypothetical protein